MLKSATARHRHQRHYAMSWTIASDYLARMHLDIPVGDFAGYLFDLDGTLIDSMPVHLRAWGTALQRVGLRVPFDADFFYSLGGVPTLESAVIFRSHYGLSFDEHQLVDEKEQLYLDLLGDVQLIEPVASFARRVAATHPVAVVTGGGPEIALPALDATGLRSLFAVVVTPLDVAPGRGKPAPDMFLLAASRLGVPPEDCLVFEDALPGIEAARTAGMHVVVVPRSS
jgi:HAD superfamily hydrolase (TIGR01509 family)